MRKFDKCCCGSVLSGEGQEEKSVREIRECSTLRAIIIEQLLRYKSSPDATPLSILSIFFLNHSKVPSSFDMLENLKLTQKVTEVDRAGWL